MAIQHGRRIHASQHTNLTPRQPAKLRRRLVSNALRRFLLERGHRPFWHNRRNHIGRSHLSPHHHRPESQRLDKPLFYVTSSADCQIFINGQLIRSLRVRQHSAPISETCALLHPDELHLLTPGENTICAILLPSQTPSYLSVQLLDMK